MTALDVASSPARAALRLGGAAGRLALRQISATMLTATDGRDVLLNSPDGWEVEQPWLWWTGPAGGNGSGGPFGNPIPGAGAGGQHVAFGGIPSVARCTSLIVDTLAALPWHVFAGVGETATQLPTPDWITDPQGLRLDGRIIQDETARAIIQQDETRLSAMDLWTQWLTSALWLGDGFMYVPNRDSAGAPLPPMFVLHPLDVSLNAGRYWIGAAGSAQEYDSDGRPELGRPFAPGEIIHIRGLEPIIGGRGTGVLTRFAGSLKYGLTIQEYAAGVFGAGVPNGYLKTTQPHIDETGAQDLKAKWMAAHGGPMRGIAVLNATTEFVPLTFTPVDANLVGVGEDFDRHVAMMFGIPPHMLGVSGDSSTYANVESRMIELSRFTYLPWSARIEAVLSAQLPRGTSLKVALDALMRADTVTRYAAYSQALSAGWLTVDEVRALEDRAPLPEDATPAPPTQLAAVPAPEADSVAV